MAGRAILLAGPPGTGKVSELLNFLELGCCNIFLNKDITIFDLLIQYTV